MGTLYKMGFTPESLLDLSGRVYIVTGGNAGLGFETAKALSLKNAKVYIGARSAPKAETAISTIQSCLPANSTASLHHLPLDHMDLSTVAAGVQAFLTQETVLHGLILNAGIMCTPYELSANGHEAHWQTNYLAHFLLTELLMPILQATALRDDVPIGSVRIVELTSAAYMWASGAGIAFEAIDLPHGKPFDRYVQSKLANILHVRELQARIGPKGDTPQRGEIWIAAIHPGLNDTGLAASYGASSLFGRTIIKLGFAAKPEKGAYGAILAAASNAFPRSWSGCYIVPPEKKSTLYRQANDHNLQEKLWAWTEDELKRLGFLR
ncbi:hypothetical protein Dda_2394 [Drechslerella dactyloides]|uniref:Uncharacterized protein n=1 Tax=Drechslerella dactyloides TaxID=74499 RepID=A0AAD6J4U0_DREDA|nr:hypothetical protein Dda_2394 [Drechslerella dactyloides]